MRSVLILFLVFLILIMVPMISCFIMSSRISNAENYDEVNNIDINN